MRFAVARQEGLTEDLVEQITDQWADSGLPERHKRALILADAYLNETGAPSAAQQAELRAEFSEPEIVEIGVGLALVHGLAKVLIVLGLEPEQMEVTVIPSPGS